jgi:uncharacterized cupredoxin-like copper-binding protein/mono/diheme cytochrome c family protein
VGAVQKLATVVIVGLVAVSTVLVLYLADENNRIKAEAQSQQRDAIERATANYLSLCLPCHGPAGEGLLGPGETGTGRIGLPLGGNTYATKLNQQGIGSDGTPAPGGVAGRAATISATIHNGRVAAGMPAWGEANGGPLNDAQIEELTTMIQNVDWNKVYNEAVATYGGYPTANPHDPRKTATPSGGKATPTATAAAGVSIEMHDIFFQPKEITIPANTPVTIHLSNLGAATHNFNIDALTIHSGDVAPGSTGTVTINAAAGDYEFHCNIPGHREAGMVGTIHVVEGATLPGSGGAIATPRQGQAPIELDLEDIHFSQTQITIAPNTPITINLVNKGAGPHNFNIDALTIHSGDIAPGASGSVTINAPPGEYEYYCNIPGHKDAGMVGKLIVK